MSASLIDRIRELGGELRLNGGKIHYRIPSTPEADEIISEIRKDREAIIALLRDRESKPPSLSEVRAALPATVRVVSYHPKQAPFAVAPVSVVTNTGKFFQAYLRDLKARLEKPEGYHCPPLADILGKLYDAGLELQVEKPSPGVPDDDIPF